MNEDYSKVNPLLRKIMKEIYTNRTPLPTGIITQVRTEHVNDKAFCEIWFMTRGCSHDAKGGCTMCNYGKGHEVNQSRVISELKEQIRNLPSELQELIVTPTGSMFDEAEVPESMRFQIFQLLRNISCYDFFIETRLDSLTESKLKTLKDNIHADHINIEVGVECCDDWILRNCVNKNMNLSDLERGIKLVHNCGMYICANIGIGIPFLSERCNIALAKKSIQKAFALGCDNVVLFPYHVKPGTLLEWLWQKNLYNCCSLWAIPEVLSDFTPDELKRIQISWYRNYYTDKKKIISSPQVEEQDMENVLLLLDEYKNHPGIQALMPLLDYNSSDKEQWKQRISTQSHAVVPEDMKRIYFFMAEEFHLSSEEMKAEWDNMKSTFGGEEGALSL